MKKENENEKELMMEAFEPISDMFIALIGAQKHIKRMLDFYKKCGAVTDDSVAILSQHKKDLSEAHKVLDKSIIDIIDCYL